MQSRDPFEGVIQLRNTAKLDFMAMTNMVSLQEAIQVVGGTATTSVKRDEETEIGNLSALVF